MIICFEEKNWRPDDKTLINTGYYWIPRDMTEDLARRALAEGVAILIEDEAEQDDKAPKPGYGGDGSGESSNGLGGPGRRGRPRKGPAPENKAR